MNAAVDHSADAEFLELVPLGGVGEFGMNMLAISSRGCTVLVDAGVMFPDPDQLGVDLIIPDLAYVEERRQEVQALVLTHGHEDHIGAVAHVFRLIDGPVYGTPLTLALVERRLEEHGIDPGDRLRAIKAGESFTVGPFGIEFIRVTHSMPDCVALAIQTPLGMVVHTGDFKVDYTPIDGERFNLHRFAELGASGVLALLGDSTNVDQPGVAGSERDVIEAFDEIFSSSSGLIVVAAFSSSLHRIQVLVDLAVRFSRNVAFVGRSLVQNVDIGQRLGFLTIPNGVQIRDADVSSHPPARVLCIATGSQGEPRAALTRIAIDDHRHIHLAPGDTVVLSARSIPGNEKAIARTMSHLARRGATVVTSRMKRVHVSGHAYQEELTLVHSLLSPRYFVPVHGEYRQLALHTQLATRVAGTTGEGVTCVLAQNGDRIIIDGNGARIDGRVPAGRVLIDDTRLGEVDDQVLRDRRQIAGDGLVVAVVAIDQNGCLVGTPEIVSRGFVTGVADADDLFDRAAAAIGGCIDRSSVEERTDQGLMSEKLRVELRRFFKKQAGRRPMVLPVLMEV